MTEFRPTKDYIPPMGKRWLLPLYDPFSRLARVRRVHEQLLDRAGLRDGQRIVEIGCGTGNLLTALARRGLDVEALGIDPDRGALDRARRKAARRSLPIRYEQAFASELPVPDGSVDRVLSALMLHHLDADERQAALREVRRVLRTGGWLHVVDVDGRIGRGRSRTAGGVPEAMIDAGLTGVTENGRAGPYVFYRAGV